MLEYLNKKNRKHKDRDTGKAPDTSSAAASSTASPSPGTASPVPDVAVLDRDERSFLENLTQHWGASEDDEDDRDGGGRPPLPPRIKTPDLTWDSDSESFVREERLVAVDNDTLKPQPSRSSGGVAVVGRRLSKLFRKPPKAHAAHLAVPGYADADADPGKALVLAPSEEDREQQDLARVLDDLDVGRAEKGGGKDKKERRKFTVALSAESAALVRRFVVVLKDLVHGVPTAADDMRGLLDDRDGALARAFERLPSSLRKLVAQLPSKLTASLGPELLAVMAESQGVAAEEIGGVSAASAAKAMLLPLVTKPSAIVKMLKAIMNVLKLRWPAFIGTSAIWTVALFLLMFVLWYCHKRGREVRLEKEATAAGEAADDGEPPIAIREIGPGEAAPR